MITQRTIHGNSAVNARPALGHRAPPPFLSTFLDVLRREPPAHRVLGDAAGQQKLEQVIRAAGLGADARELEAAERLAVDQGPGDPAVDVQIADAELALDSLDVRRAARVRPPVRAYGVPLAIAGPRRGRSPSSTASTGPKISSWATRAPGWTSAKIIGPTK